MRSSVASLACALVLAACGEDDGLAPALEAEGSTPGPDAGAVQPSLPDAGDGDSGATDAGAMDAGTADLGLGDAGASPLSEECASGLEAEVIELANEARAQEGAGPLRCATELAQVARAHSQDMCDQGYFDHTNLAGESPFDRMSEAGISYGAAAENIARGQPTARVVHEAWMASPGHRRNIMNARLGRIGVGYVACPSGRPHYWTQVFAD